MAQSYVARAALTPGATNFQAEQRKRREFQQFGAGAGFDFIPLATETFGRLGREASRFLSDLGDIAAENGRVSKGSFVRSARQSLSCALCRGLGRQYSASMLSVARATGVNFLPGCAVPVDEVGAL